MLQTMRDKMQGIIAGSIAVIIAVVFSLWGVQNYLGSGASNVAAKVNGEEITKDQLNLAYEQAKRIKMMQFGSDFLLDPKKQAAFKDEILQNLIEQEVIYQAETKMGMGIGRNQLLAMVNGMPAFQVKGVFSPERFHQIISRMYRSEQIFFSEIERSLLKIQLEKAIKKTSFVLPNETSNIKTIFKQKRDFSYLNLSPKRFMKDVKVSSSDVEQYYEENRKEFLLPEKISIQYVELASGDFRSSMKPTEKQYKMFYQTHLDSFSSPKKWQITKFLLPLSIQADDKKIDAAIKELDDVIAKLKSQEDVKSLSNNLKITTSWVTRNELPSELGVRLEKLKVGEVSRPFRTQEGYNLIKVLDIKQPQATPYRKVREKVIESYDRYELAKVFAEASDKLADMVYTNSDTLKPAADELILKIKETGLFTSSGGKEGILSNTKVVRTAFSDMVLQQRYNSGLIEVEPGRVIVLRIKEHIPERIKPLEKVRSGIINKLKITKAKERASLIANKILQEIQGGNSNSKLISKYGLSWDKVSGAAYYDRNDSSKTKLIKAAFALFRPVDRQVSTSLVDFDNGYAVVRLDKVYDDKTGKESAREKGFIKSLPRLLGDFEYLSLLDNFKKQAKIKMFGGV